MKNIDKEIDKTLSSLQGARRATVSPSFEDDMWQKLSFLPQTNAWVRWLRYGAAAMIVLGLVNIFALFSLSQSDETTDLGTAIAEELYDTDYFFESTE